MKLLRLVFLASGALLAACSGKTTQSPLSVSLSFAPSPPIKGFETLTVTVRDANGKAVTRAHVQIKTTMPRMSMSGPTFTPTDKGTGHYAVRGNLQYATTWVFDVIATADGSTGTAHVTQGVK